MITTNKLNQALEDFESAGFKNFKEFEETCMAVGQSKDVNKLETRKAITCYEFLYVSELRVQALVDNDTPLLDAMVTVCCNAMMHIEGMKVERVAAVAKTIKKDFKTATEMLVTLYKIKPEVTVLSLLNTMDDISGDMSDSDVSKITSNLKVSVEGFGKNKSSKEDLISELMELLK